MFFIKSKRKEYFIKTYKINLNDYKNIHIDNFAYLNNRNDIGALWENFLITERLKKNEYQNHYCSQYFWRTYTGAELDYVEEYDGKLYRYEFKWNKSAKAPESWTQTYGAEYSCINKDNFIGFTCPN